MQEPGCGRSCLGSGPREVVRHAPAEHLCAQRRTSNQQQIADRGKREFFEIDHVEAPSVPAQPGGMQWKTGCMKTDTSGPRTFKSRLRAVDG